MQVAPLRIPLDQFPCRCGHIRASHHRDRGDGTYHACLAHYCDCDGYTAAIPQSGPTASIDVLSTERIP